MTLRPDDMGLIRAAGAVVWRETPAGVEVALVHRERYDDWSFPKGKLDRGEHPLCAAVREVFEETALPVRLGRRLPTIGYPKDGRAKQVDYWAATATEFARFVPNDEVDRLDWLSIPAATARLSYGHDRDVLRALLAAPLRTASYIVLRHASAGEKSRWPGDDALRPLDPRGRVEAGELAGLLSAYGRARVLSSATARCVETVLPYARHERTEVTTARELTVGQGGGPEAVARLLDLVESGEPAIACTHGEIVTGLVTDLCTRLAGKVPDDPALRKAAFWVLHVADGTMVGLEHHDVRDVR